MKVIAELGLCTNGDLDTALRMVEAAAEAGCDGVKVQAFEVRDFLPEGHQDWWMFSRGRLEWDELLLVQLRAKECGLLFGATPTSLDGVKRLADMGVDWLKNGSDYLLRHDMIEAMLATGIETWVATGMATPQEIAKVPDEANLMACTSVYPCPPEQAHLNRLRRSEILDWADGYSDHTTSLNTAALCAVLGAKMYETHCTLSHDMEGPDHHFSRDPEELAEIVRRVREAEVLLGSSDFGPTPGEVANREAWRVTEGTLRP